MSRRRSLAPPMFASKHIPCVNTVVEPPQRGDPTVTNQQASSPLLVSETQTSFTQSQLCLALSIAKSRPLDLSIRDYCLLLRKHIKHSKAPLEDRRYIDTPEFWRDQYSKLHREKVGLEDEVARLEQLVYQLGENKPPPRQSSRSEDEVEKQEAPIIVLQDLGESSQKLQELKSTNCLMLLKHSQSLHKLIGDKSVPADVLSKVILSSISCLEQVLSDICNVSGFLAHHAGQGTICQTLRVFKFAAGFFNLCLKGLAHLCRDICGRRCKGQVVYALVNFFTSTLQNFHQMCTLELPSSPLTNLYPLRYRQTVELQEGKGNIVSVLIRETHEFLLNILTSPEFQEPNTANAEVFEGLLSSLLNRIGCLVSQNVFHSQLAISKNPGRICCNSTCDTGMQNKATNLEGQHLVCILKTTLKNRNEKDQHTLSKMLSGGEVISSTTGEEPLLARAKRRLQETLLKGIFGQDGGDFINALKIPEFEEGWENETIPTGGEKGETFIELVWSVIGWDLALKP